MKEILIKYPINVLKKELINVRTDYRFEKKKIIEILKGFKSINKLNKEQIIELLVKNNYDINRLPKEYYKLPKKLEKYLDIDMIEVENLNKEGKLNNIYRDIVKFFYKNNEEFKLRVDKIIEGRKKVIELRKFLEEAKLKKDKKAIEKDIENNIDNNSILYKKAILVLDKAFTSLLFFQYFDYGIIDDLVKSQL